MTVLGKFVLSYLHENRWPVMAEMAVELSENLQWLPHVGDSMPTVLDTILTARSETLLMSHLTEALRSQDKDRCRQLDKVMKLILTDYLRPKLKKALGMKAPHMLASTPELRLSFEWAHAADRLEPAMPPSCKLKPMLVYVGEEDVVV